jgi:Sortase and related acyltransferases
MNTDLIIRTAEEGDAQSLIEIYAPYVKETAITFEYDVPSVEEFAGRIRSTLKKYPYLVALENGRIIGYAYASAFKTRAAYDWAVETSIYLSRDSRGKGLGRELYTALEDALKRQNILNLNACIAYAAVEDSYLTNTSEAFHAKMGYTRVAYFKSCGYKFKTWYDMIWMEKIIGEHEAEPKPVIAFPDLAN